MGCVGDLKKNIRELVFVHSRVWGTFVFECFFFRISSILARTCFQLIVLACLVSTGN